MDFLQWVLFFVIIYSALNALRFSRGSRSATDSKQKGVQAAKMNMHLGAMLISMGIIQVFYYEGETFRLIIGSVFLLLGLFNLFAGYRNHSKWSKLA